MNKLLVILAAACLGSPVFAQDTKTAAKPATKANNYDADLPSWCFDLNLKGGLTSQSLSMMDLKSNLINPLNANIADTKFKNGMSYGFDAQIGYFFGEKKHFGVGLGFMYLYQTGDMTLDNYHVEYQSTDYQNNIFRQLVTANNPIKESLKTTNMSIPLVFKYKNQFNKHWGFALDAGILYNLQTSNSYTTDASFDYEAIYKYTKGSDGKPVAVYDNSSTPDPSSWLITKAYYSAKNSAGSVVDTFNKLHAQGYNVGLNQASANNKGTTSYQTGSFGFLLKPSMSYLVGRNVALDFGLYYMYNQYTNKTSNTYKLTDQVGDYNSLTNAAKTVSSSNIGLNLGVRVYFGKPKDTDHDGIPDKKDLCPDQFGELRFHGCPDRDGDGIPDREDDCPDVPGVAQFHGCPDTDGDGIPDKDDACPTVKGLPQFAGCPDRDGDGIPDKDDACPDQKGTAQFHGCPDTDGDGIPDNLDKCPNEAGPASNNGCPLPTPEPPAPAEVHIDISAPILFEVNRTVIRESAYPTMEEAVKRLKEDPKAVVVIDGYADNTGSDGYNKVLSLKRANEVKKWLMKHGAKAKQLKAVGHGSTDPSAPNDTEEGRAQNRRAVMQMKEGKK